MLFEVWAPNARGSVDLVTGSGERVPMSSTAGGWWRVEVSGVDRYGYSIDGGDVRPDPRSPWQPDGPDALSAVVDHDAYAWGHEHFVGRPLASSVIYELHVGTFSEEGTFEGAIERLDHLVDLGVDYVELLPVAEFPGSRGWGYDGVDLYAPFSGYGGPDGLKVFVDACHGRGLGVVMDVVYNHLGPAGNYLGEFGPYFTDRYATPWGMAVNLDGPHSDEVRAFFLDNALSWLRDYRCDGLRLDAVHAIVDTSAMHLLEELAERVERFNLEAGRHCFLVAESDLNDPRVVRERALGGYGMDAQWSDDFHHALHVTLTGERSGYYEDFDGLGDVARALEHVFVHAGAYSPHRRRRHGRAPVGIPHARFLGYLQNHDQVGNRATGERSSHLMSVDRLKVGAALVLLGPFVPLLFRGEEWGATSPFQYFTDHPDADLGRAVSEGRRREFSAFGWKPEDVPDPQDAETFTRSKLRWSELTDEPHASLLEWHRALIGLRRSMGDLGDDVDVTHDEDAGWLVLRRGPLGVAMNIGMAPVAVPLGRNIAVLASSHEDVDVSSFSAKMPPDSVLVFSV